MLTPMTSVIISLLMILPKSSGYRWLWLKVLIKNYLVIGYEKDARCFHGSASFFLAERPTYVRRKNFTSGCAGYRRPCLAKKTQNPGLLAYELTIFSGHK